MLRTIIILILFILSISGLAQNNFDKYFTDNVLRFDAKLAGNNETTVVYPAGVKEYYVLRWIAE